MAITETPVRYADASTLRVTADNGIEYAYRDLGKSGMSLVLLQHFRGNLDNWDPALVDALAADRRVVTFDNVGVGATTGKTPDTVEAMAHDAIAFIEALSLQRVDLLGFSIGSFVAQEIALIRPDLLRRVVLASSAPQGAAGMHGWAPEVIGAVGAPETSPQGYLEVFFAPTETSREAGQQVMGRIFGRTTNRDEPTSWQTRQAQYDAVCAWGIPNHSLLQRVAVIDLPVFVANGDSDPMILPRYSHLLAGLLPDADHDLPGLGARLPLPAPQPVRGRRSRLPRGGRLIRVTTLILDSAVAIVARGREHAQTIGAVTGGGGHLLAFARIDVESSAPNREHPLRTSCRARPRPAARERHRRRRPTAWLWSLAAMITPASALSSV